MRQLDNRKEEGEYFTSTQEEDRTFAKISPNHDSTNVNSGENKQLFYVWKMNSSILSDLTNIALYT